MQMFMIKCKHSAGPGWSELKWYVNGRLRRKVPRPNSDRYRLSDERNLVLSLTAYVTSTEDPEIVNAMRE